MSSVYRYNKWYRCNGRNRCRCNCRKNYEKEAGRCKNCIVRVLGFNFSIVFATIVFLHSSHTMVTLIWFIWFLFMNQERQILQLISLSRSANGIWKCSNKRENMFLVTQRGELFGKWLSYTAVSFVSGLTFSSFLFSIFLSLWRVFRFPTFACQGTRLRKLSNH